MRISESLFTEHLIYLPTCYHFYSISRNRFRFDGLPEQHHSSLPKQHHSLGGGGGKGVGGVILDAQVNTDRIEGHMWDIWLRLLASNENATIRLRQGQNTAKEHDLLVNNLAVSAERAAVSRHRLVFLRKIEPKSAHLERMSTGSDLFLDTDSYSAHSTGLEALWAGVPLLTFPRSFASCASCPYVLL